MRSGWRRNRTLSAEPETLSEAPEEPYTEPAGGLPELERIDFTGLSEMVWAPSLRRSPRRIRLPVRIRVIWPIRRLAW